MKLKPFFELAIKNITKFGDTDVFPFPIENHIFYDKFTDVIDILNKVHKNFDEMLMKVPPVQVKSLSVVGYSGFRSSTQIDPFWNVYFLSLVISIGEDIERVRIPIGKKMIFSYRFKPDKSEGSLFDREIGWTEFQENSIEKAKEYSFVLSTDIADFYPRIYHHRLENALKKATSNTEIIRRIMELLSRFAENVSYGLPIGGPAARLLSELLLNRTDRLLISEKISFCRWVDDYHIFAESREEAYEYLVSLSEMLLVNEGLSLQRIKTRIMSKEEFLSTSRFAEENEPDTEEEIQSRNLAKLRIKYDPYSPTADEDYELLKKEIKKFDIVGLLAREIRKSRIDESITRRLVRSVKFLDPIVQNQAVLSLIDNLELLYPIFPVTMIVVKSVIPKLSEVTRQRCFDKLRALIKTKSYIIKVPANLSFALRVLTHDDSEETDSILTALYKEPVNMMIKRDIILIMAKRNADYWISNCKQQYAVLSPWEQRALLVSSYILEDEGDHWRKLIKKGLSEMDDLSMQWAAEKKSKGQWDIPI